MPSATRTSSTTSPIRARKGRRRRCAKAADKNVRAVFAVERKSGPGGSAKANGESRRVSEVEIVCERLGCNTNVTCCLKLVDSCLGTSTLNARTWSHETAGEHYCGECRDSILKSTGIYNAAYTEWRDKWLNATRRESTPRIFVADALLPYCIRCVECHAWRTYRQPLTPVTTAFMETFTCAQSVEFETSDAKTNPCLVKDGHAQKWAHKLDPASTKSANLKDIKPDVNESLAPTLTAEELGVEVSTEEQTAWLSALMIPLLIHHSPTLYFLKDYYFNDEIGQSAVYGMHSDDTRDESLNDLSAPFNIPGETMMAQSVRPDVMEYDEMVRFPEYSNEPSVYLGLRNLLIAKWHLQPKKWLTAADVESRVNCRGLMRIHACQVLRRVWRLLSTRGMINSGCVLPPYIRSPMTSPKTKKHSEYTVAIIGAGIAGLTAASQLGKHGIDCVVLEAGETLGGRMRDDWSLGVAVGMGAQLVTGVVNNPVTLMCYQCDVEYRAVGDACPLLDATTASIVDAGADRRVDLHFNCILDAIDDWRTTCLPAQPGVVQKATLQDQMLNMHTQFVNGGKSKWSSDEERCMQWQLGNTEFSCGARLSDVSAAYWDQNEMYAQFAGPHALLHQGSEAFLRPLAKSLNIRYNSAVMAVDRENGHVVVTCKDGKDVRSQKVIIALPLSVLQSTDVNCITYTPPLPIVKQKAINALGAGCIEKVACQFDSRFWSHLATKDGESDYFGHVPKDHTERGLFNMFYDLSSSRTTSDDPTANYVLMSYVCGDNINLVNELDDDGVVAVFMTTLRKLFPPDTVPDPIGHVVTHWRRDPHFGMSYSYVRAGGTGEDYDRIAAPTSDRLLYFAGECTNRLVPQTMTGACMSGYREAARVIDHLVEGGKKNNEEE